MLGNVTGLSRHFTVDTLRAYLLDRSHRRDDGCLVVRGYGSRRGVHQKVAGRAWAHIAAYAVFVGGYDPALDVDHLCGVRDCVEPTHLRQISRAENCRTRRPAPRCRNGHPREVDDTTGWFRRVCRVCNRDNQRRWREREAELVAQAAQVTPSPPHTPVMSARAILAEPPAGGKAAARHVEPGRHTP